MSQPVKRNDVNNIKNNILSKGLAPDKIIAYFIMFFVGYIFLVISKRLNIPMTNWVASIGFPVLGVWYVLYILTYENQPYYQLIAPFINFISSGNHRKKVMESSYDIREPSILNNKSENGFVAILRVYPKNIFTLTDADRVNTTQRFATDFLNNIRGKRFEILMRNRTATVADYKSYFDYYLDMKTEDLAKLSPHTIESMNTHLIEVENALENGVMKYKELYLELHIHKSEVETDNVFNLDSEISSIKKILKDVGINTAKLSQKETEEYLPKFVLFKSTEEINNPISETETMTEDEKTTDPEVVEVVLPNLDLEIDEVGIISELQEENIEPEKPKQSKKVRAKIKRKVKESKTKSNVPA
jgi:hypothetical protein